MKSSSVLEVYILIAVEPKSKMADVERKIVRLRRLQELMEVLGPYEVMAKFRFRDKDQLVRVLDDLSRMDGVKDYLVLIITKKLETRS